MASATAVLPAAKLKLLPGSREAHAGSGSLPADLYPGQWRDYAVELPGGSPETAACLVPADRPGVMDLESILVTVGGDRAGMLRFEATEGLQSLRCEGDVMPLPGGACARFFCFGRNPRLALPPETRSDLPLRVELRMRWSEDLAPVAAALRPLNSGGDAARAGLLELRAQVLAHQAERVALAAEYRRLKANEYSLQAAQNRLEAALRGERDAARENHAALEASRQQAALALFSSARLQAESSERLAMAVEIERLHLEVSRLGKQLHPAVRAAGELRRERDELLQSYSWKVTAPLRKVFGFMRARPLE